MWGLFMTLSFFLDGDDGDDDGDDGDDKSTIADDFAPLLEISD